MKDLFFKQYEMARNRFIKEVQSIDPGIVDIQPKGFNNHIHWMVGHVLTVAENLMFGYADKWSLPLNYKDLFGNGTKPADWSGDVPSLQDLIEQLLDQLSRIKEIPVQQLEQKLDKPFREFETYGELGNLAVFHEANHLGQIHTMARLVSTQK